MGLCARHARGIKLLCLAIAMLLAPGPILVGQTNAASCAAGHYKVIQLPLRPAHINESGQVAGTTQGHRAALWSKPSGLHEIPLPAGFYNSEAVAVNNSGHIAGVAYDRTFNKHQAFIFADDVLTMLTGEQSRPYDISDSDEVVGESLLPGKKTSDAVSWTKNTIRALGGCCGGAAKSINKAGEAIGDVYDAKGRYQAFLWKENQGIQPIGPPDRYSSAIAINDRGRVVVQAFSEIFLYAEKSLTHLELSPKYPVQPRALNNCDVIVGSFGPFADAERAFVWDRSRAFRDLNDYIASDSGWKLESASSINDRGEIVGRGDYRGQDDTGFLLIPEP